MRQAGTNGFIRLRDNRKLRIPRTAATHAGFRRWVTSLRFPEEVGPTFVDGQVWFTVSPESLETHNKVKVVFTSVLSHLVSARDLGEVYADRAVFSNVRARVTTEPDFQFVSWDASETGRVTLSRRKQRQEEFIEIVGTPDMVLEIVSDSSLRKDLRLLRAAYERAGVPEYWLCDAREEQIRFEILALGPDGYRATAPSDQPQASHVFGARFALRRARNRLGRYAYTLEVT
jgi:Uma2 family endonuclease